MKTLKIGLAGILLLAISCTKQSTAVHNATAQSLNNSVTAHYIGERFGGGIIFYLDNTGQHGLIADTVDLPTAPWDNGTNMVTGATKTGIGSGKSNTRKIVAAQGTSGSYAALECSKSKRSGYKDWFLPSKKELNELHIQKDSGVVSGFADYYYWSSSESDISQAYLQVFTYGGQSAYWKYFESCVRAIRSF